MLASLRAIRELHIPVDRLECITSMSRDNTMLPFMLAFDSNQNSSSNHLAKQCLVLLLFGQALL